MLLHDTLVHPLRLTQLRGTLQHAVLQVQHLLQRVVEEGRGEGDAVGAAAVEPHLEFARALLLIGFGRLGSLLLAGLWSMCVC